MRPCMAVKHERAVSSEFHGVVDAVRREALAASRPASISACQEEPSVSIRAVDPNTVFISPPLP